MWHTCSQCAWLISMRSVQFDIGKTKKAAVMKKNKNNSIKFAQMINLIVISESQFECYDWHCLCAGKQKDKQVKEECLCSETLSLTRNLIFLNLCNLWTAKTSSPWNPGGQTMSACWKGSGRAAQSWGAPGCRGMLLWATAAMEAAEGW